MREFAAKCHVSFWLGIISVIITAAAMHPLTALIAVPLNIGVLLLMRIAAKLEGEYASRRT